MLIDCFSDVLQRRYCVWVPESIDATVVGERPYWTITDDEERLQSAYRLHRHYETADEQYGEERLEDLQTDEMEKVQ